jgi:mRNA interferase MazF
MRNSTQGTFYLFRNKFPGGRIICAGETGDGGQRTFGFSGGGPPGEGMMAISSQLRATASLGETWVVGWQAAKLLKPSAIKPVFATIEQSLVLKQFGRLQPSDEVALGTAIASVLA